MIELRINNVIDRHNVIVALNEAGYTTTVVERNIKHEYLKTDTFVVVLESPKLPEYYTKEEVDNWESTKAS
jgi:hypothetical protein